MLLSGAILCVIVAAPFLALPNLTAWAVLYCTICALMSPKDGAAHIDDRTARDASVHLSFVHQPAQRWAAPPAGKALLMGE